MTVLVSRQAAAGQEPVSLPQPAGQVWQGDAFDLAGKLPARSLDLIITSPPYWGLRDYGLDHDETVLARWRGLERAEPPSFEWYRAAGGVLGLEPYPAWYVQHLVEVFDRLRPALRGDGSLWVNLGDTYFARWSSIRDDGRQGLTSGARKRRVTPTGGYLHDKQLLMVPARFAIAMQEVGWILRNDLIWSKGLVAPRRQGDRLRSSHEHFFHFVQRTPGARPTYFYDPEAVEEGARDVVSCRPRQADPNHTAAFPEDLVRPRILSCSRPAGIVLDPFCGTGTAVAVAVAAGREGRGFELSQRHAVAAQERVEVANCERQLQVAAEADRHGPADAGSLGERIGATALLDRGGAWNTSAGLDAGQTDLRPRNVSGTGWHSKRGTRLRVFAAKLGFLVGRRQSRETRVQ